MKYLFNYNKQKELSELLDLSEGAPDTLNEIEVLTPVINELDNVYTQANNIHDPMFHYHMDKILGLAFMNDNPDFDKLDEKFSNISSTAQFASIKTSLKKIYVIRMGYWTRQEFLKHYAVQSHGEIVILGQSNFKNKTQREVKDFFVQYDRELNQAIAAKASNPDIKLPESSPELVALKKTLKFY